MANPNRSGFSTHRHLVRKIVAVLLLLACLTFAGFGIAAFVIAEPAIPKPIGTDAFAYAPESASQQFEQQIVRLYPIATSAAWVGVGMLLAVMTWKKTSVV